MHPALAKLGAHAAGSLELITAVRETLYAVVNDSLSLEEAAQHFTSAAFLKARARIAGSTRADHRAACGCGRAARGFHPSGRHGARYRRSGAFAAINESCIC